MNGYQDLLSTRGVGLKRREEVDLDRMLMASSCCGVQAAGGKEGQEISFSLTYFLPQSYYNSLYSLRVYFVFSFYILLFGLFPVSSASFTVGGKTTTPSLNTQIWTMASIHCHHRLHHESFAALPNGQNQIPNFQGSW